jgi:hypothetical protein
MPSVLLFSKKLIRSILFAIETLCKTLLSLILVVVENQNFHVPAQKKCVLLNLGINTILWAVKNFM